MATNVQFAPDPNLRSSSAAKASSAPEKASGKVSGLAALPQSAGIAVLAVMLAASLFIGNFRALQSVTPSAFNTREIKTIVEDRLSNAANALTVSRRADIDPSGYTAVEEAMTALKNAKTAGEISRANQLLTTAVSRLAVDATDLLSESDRRLFQRSVDDFTEQGNFLRQEGRAYNTKADKAVSLYKKLPTRFVLPEPDYYEGI